MYYVLSAFLLFLALFFIAAHHFYVYAFRRDEAFSKKSYALIENITRAEYLEDIKAATAYLESLPSEQVYIKSRDGLKLAAKFYPVKDQRGIVIMFHGYRSTALYDMSGYCETFLDDGISILLVDQRAHGLSEGRKMTFGVKERYDCLGWAEYAAERFGRDIPIMLLGASMGAATVVLASELPLPDNVTGIIADSCFTSQEEMMKDTLVRRGFYLPVFWPIARFIARFFGGFDPLACPPEKALKRCSLPLLFIHGECDNVTPYEMSMRNYENCASEKAIVTVSGAGHCLCCLADGEKVLSAVSGFINEHCLKGVKA